MIRTDLIAPIGTLLKRHAAERPDKTAFEDVRGRLTYAELEHQSARLATFLQGDDRPAGETVALLLPNGVDWVLSCLSVARAGAVSVPISHDATEAEIRYRLEDAACGTVVCSPRHVPAMLRLQAELPRLTRVLVCGEGDGRIEGATSLASVLQAAGPAAPRDPESLDDTAFIVYTSGTTGRAKGVMLTLRSMLWVVASCWAPIAGLAEQDVVLSPLPLFHSYALNLSVLAIVAVGATEFILEKYSTQDVVARLRSGRYTVMPGVPTMFHYLLESQRGEDTEPVRGVRAFLSAGAILPGPLNQAFEAHFGVPLLDGYGITETSTMVTMNWPCGERTMGSCGLPLPGLAVRLVAPDGSDVPPGAEGELIVRGPNTMQGYLNKPDETAAALANGWYHTGDLARSDANGFLTITGRLKELIIRGGQNIAPAEVETAVLSFEAVLDCAVVGVAHPHLGEVPVAFVVLREGQAVDPAAVIAHCATQLSSYKLPSAVHVVDEIPRTGSGKVMRFKLRERL